MRAEDRVRVLHMIEAAETLEGFIVSRSRADLDSDRMLLFAVVRAIELIGEAASKVSEETRLNAPEIPWAAIVGMRNRLVHGYFDIDTEIVWETASREAPGLLSQLRAWIETQQA
ncbi:MAG: HepT-like ribonuclease domain-containing protein [Blastocatellia bacterium]|nr:HepT-like ribonuclease domain-containing protein [Blastocatellia bacterium]